MSDAKKSMPAEAQKERWVKYGANVVLTAVVVVLVGVVLVYLAQEHHKRIDTTLSHVNSLTPQTTGLLDGLKGKIKLVSLYTTQANPNLADNDSAQDFSQAVADLLEEYQRSSSNVEVEIIDPITEPSKVDALFAEVTQRYGKDLKLYKEVIDEFPRTVEQINKLAAAELAKIPAVPADVSDMTLAQTMNLTRLTVADIPDSLAEIQDRIARELKKKTPDYKAAAQRMDEGLSVLTVFSDAILKNFKQYADDSRVPQEWRDYMRQSPPRFEAIKKPADDLLARMKNLGELKQLDDLRQQKSNSIVIMADNDMKVLPFGAVWSPPQSVRGMDPAAATRLRFAGEREVTTAIYSLTNPKKKIAFVRWGGPPLTASITQEAPLAIVAIRLREYNFELVDKDLSGQWEAQAMQMQMQGMPVLPEPREEEIADAVWVVVSGSPRQSQAGTSLLGDKLAEHLKRGGSAVVLLSFQADNLDVALKDWGVEVQTDALAVHEAVPGADTGDEIEDALRRQPIFGLTHYGDHPLARPLESLQSVFVPLVPVLLHPVSGNDAQPLLPLGKGCWATHNLEAIQRGQSLTFQGPHDGLPGDIPGPIFGGAAVARADGQRLVTIGCVQFALDGMVTMLDPEMHKHGRDVARFPGNQALFMNSVFWTAHMESMMQISPEALEVSRIATISDGTLNLWRLGVLVVGLPCLVLCAAALVYNARRE